MLKGLSNTNITGSLHDVILEGYEGENSFNFLRITGLNCY